MWAKISGQSVRTIRFEFGKAILLIYLTTGSASTWSPIPPPTVSILKEQKRAELAMLYSVRGRKNKALPTPVRE